VRRRMVEDSMLAALGWRGLRRTKLRLKWPTRPSLFNGKIYIGS